MDDLIMGVKVTAVTEEYLEGIYRLQIKSGVARTSEIVKLLQVTPGTVTNTVKQLKKDGLVIHEPYKGVRLTESGRKIALRVLRRHRLSERLLTDVLHVESSKAHDAACRLEHGITDDIEKNLEKALSHPKTCPHGNPIPTKCGGIIEEEESKPLTSFKPQEKGIVLKITEEEAEILQYLTKLGLTPGVAIEIVEKAPFNGPITIRVDKSTCALSQNLASIINVKKV